MHPVGIGLRPGHIDEILATKPKIDFLEAHSENYFGGGKLRRDLLALRQDYNVSLHGVGLSLGRADGLDKQHLADLKLLVDAVEPFHVSEHLSWSAYSHIHLPDLLPLPLTKEAFYVFAAHVEEMQDVLGREILIENPSNYLAFAEADLDEPTFLNDLCAKVGCKLLLDVNNIYVTAHNLQRNAQDYITVIEGKHVAQYHLAGYEEVTTGDETVFIDTHGEPVHGEVWEGYDFTLRTIGDKPTLLEWDTNLPALDVLLAERDKIEVARAKVVQQVAA